MARLGARTRSVFSGPKSALNNVSAAAPDTRFAATVITVNRCTNNVLVAKIASPNFIRAIAVFRRDMREQGRRGLITMAIAAEVAWISKPTFIRVERGDPSVSIESYATVLYVLGMRHRLGDLAAPKNHPVGLQLE